ncbi:MAG: hypothetical protein K1000chlam2_01279 [Chlamydiae bacterium]|nr:hypothetical protein [Chlamydiota bacterium]
MLNKLIIPLLLLSSICTNPLSADFSVGQAQPTGLDTILGKTAAGIARGLQRSQEEAQRKRVIEELIRAQQLENEKRARIIQIEKEKNARIIQEILENYDPSKNTEFVIKILQSTLPEDQKKAIVDCLDNQYNAYLLEKNKKKDKQIFSWFLKK